MFVAFGEGRGSAVSVQSGVYLYSGLPGGRDRLGVRSTCFLVNYVVIVAIRIFTK